MIIKEQKKSRYTLKKIIVLQRKNEINKYKADFTSFTKNQ